MYLNKDWKSSFAFIAPSSLLRLIKFQLKQNESLKDIKRRRTTSGNDMLDNDNGVEAKAIFYKSTNAIKTNSTGFRPQ